MTKKNKTVTQPAPILARFIPRPIESEMRESYLDYAMSVIVSRALPDVRDGLKPVHRRILYAMHQLGLSPGAKFRKSAAIVGEVLGKLHPHGDASVYDALVRMAQDFSMRAPLVWGQGNFGCFTKDTKVRLVDGRNLTFEELIAEDVLGKRNYTYTVKALGNIAIAEIRHPRLTIKDAELVRVTLDNGEQIRCTPNHRFMLRSGEYCEAQDLKWGDSLMPLYERLSEKTDRLNREGYNLIYQNKTSEWVPVHHLADNFNLTLGVYKKSNGRVRHHVDFNKLNNKNNSELVLLELNRNHKVISVERLSGRENVYDLTIDGTHNFCLAAGVFVHNSVDGDSAAAFRYTEAKLTQVAVALLDDLEKETVNFVPNYDGTTVEPKVLPARIPNLLVNGTVGIAVGMATEVPTHNLGEVVAATRALLADPDIDLEGLMTHIPGPDFPTAGILYGKDDLREAFATGRGGAVVRGRAEIVEGKGGEIAIIISELPYQTNKATFVTHIADLVREKKIEGIRDLRDESNREGIRVVVELKSGAYPKKILNALYEYTELQTTIHYNMLALVDGIQPRVLTLKDCLSEFLKHRREVVRRRTEFDLKRTRERIHILEGLKVAIDHIDAVISLIKKSADREAARVALMAKYKLSEAQANAILDMRLAQLANLERQKVESELAEKKKYADELVDLLSHPKKMDKVIDRELEEVATRHATPRKTQIIGARVKEFLETDLIPDEPTIITLTRTGYIKRLAPDTFRTQGRGGKGVRGAAMGEEDIVEHLIATTTHANLLFFTTRGRVFELQAYDVPIGSRTAKGSLIVNFLQLAPDEKVTAVLSSQDCEACEYLIMVTRGGVVKKSKFSDFENIRRSGLIAIRLRSNDVLEWVKPTTGKDEILLVTGAGQSIRFRETNVRPMGRAAGGVIGIRLKKSDVVVGMDVIPKGALETLHVFVITSGGLGKRTPLKAYRIQGRGGSGIKTAKINSKTGKLVAAHIVNAKELEGEDMLVISSKGQAIRLPFKSVSISGRQTQGVRLMRFKEPSDSVASVTFL